MTNIFISYRDEDKKWRDAFDGLLNNPNAKINFAPIKEREDFRGTSENRIKKYLRELLLDADCLILIVV